MAENNRANAQEFSVWKKVCEEILAKPFPPHSSDFPKESLERDSHVTFAEFSTWEVVYQEVLDTEYSHVYYQTCYEELRRRGKSEHEIVEMRRLAWYTAGWLNFPMALWDWVSLDETDMLRAIALLHDRNQISQEPRLEFENFIKLHA